LYFIPEAPRYLYFKDKFDECEKSLNYIARVNGIKVEKDIGVH
jgi:hypothetical protein